MLSSSLPVCLPTFPPPQRDYIVPTTNPFLKLIQAFFFSFLLIYQIHTPYGYTKHREREREKKRMTQEHVHPHEYVQETGGVLESEKTKERETVCSVLETEDARVTDAEVGDLLSRGKSSSVLPR